MFQQVTLGAPGTTRHAASAQPEIPNGASTVTGASDIAHAVGAGKKNGRAPLLRRYSTFQQKSGKFKFLFFSKVFLTLS